MNTLWTAFETNAHTEVAQRGVTFVRPDKTPFIERAAPLTDIFANDEFSRSMLKRIASS
jgi:hypothetical protein